MRTVFIAVVSAALTAAVSVTVADDVKRAIGYGRISWGPMDASADHLSDFDNRVVVDLGAEIAFMSRPGLIAACRLAPAHPSETTRRCWWIRH